ncbi:bile acid:sodium symporter family protein [Aureispira anguillae]|uniref:Bile acid:sodium symporter family protein n=1 Tax=Aureispira anguillae TaxID=2864201 RepID=A0A915YL26_9BACT|nr:bile acid:sodium symporter family protein [Aureispira anguillae]BDS15197.1 bile acid:sodium symporter family protein [Aureispira anguillae]
MGIDNVEITFDSNTQFILKLILGFIIFGVALDIKIEDFKRVVENPKGILIGLSLQFIAFPALTFLLIWGASQSERTAFYPSVALGMLLLAACPGGNMSNFFTHLAKGNTALSVSMSAISTVAALVMTPLNFSFWGSLLPSTNSLLSVLSIDPIDMLITITILLGIPLTIGMLIAHYQAAFANKIKKPMKNFSIFFFILLIFGALAVNWQTFLDYIGTFALVVFLQNSLALTLGYWGAKAAGLSHYDSKTVSLEVGIQNSGLGLILFFQYFEHLGGMGIIVAWWGMWHMISGLTLAYYWQRKAA